MKPTIASIVMLITLAGCPSADDTATITTDEAGFSMLTGEFGEGMLLSGFLDQGSLVMVGGDLDAGAGMIARYDGDKLCVESEAPTDKAIWWIHGDGAGEWFAVGADGLILHEKDGVRTREDVKTSATFFGVWMVSTDEVWAAVSYTHLTLPTT